MNGEVALFEAKDGQVRLDARVGHETGAVRAGSFELPENH